MNQAPNDPYAGVKALFNEIQTGNEANIVRMLTGDGVPAVSPSALDQMGQSAMTVAAYWDRANIVRLLTKHGGDVNICDEHIKTTALIQTAINDRLETAAVLLELGADPDRQNRYGHTALHYAVSGKSEKMARLLLDGGADPFVADEDGTTAFYLARSSGYGPVMDIFEDWARAQEDRRLQKDREKKAEMLEAQKRRADRLSRLDRLSRRRGGKDKAP